MNCVHSGNDHLLKAEKQSDRIVQLESDLAAAQECIEQLESDLAMNPRAGKEAEELRKALEGIGEDCEAVIESTDTSVLSEMLEAVSDKLTQILDAVDARDALAYVEERAASAKALAAAQAENERLREEKATEFVDWYLNRQKVVRVEGASAMKVAIRLFLQERAVLAAADGREVKP